MAKQKKSKPLAPELISLSELARRAGVTRAAVTVWIHNQEAQGINLVQPSGRRGKVVDANNPLVRHYVQNTYGKSERLENDNKDAGKKSANTLRKLRYQAKKIHLQNIALREKYIDTKSAWELFDKLLEIEADVFDGFSGRVLKRIKTELGCTITPESRKKAKAFIDEAIADAHIAHCRIVSDFKRDTKPKYAP